MTSYPSPNPGAGYDGTSTLVPADHEISRLRLLWDRVPSVVRRQVIKLMRSERIRTRVLSRLGIRDENAFFALSNGGVTAINTAMDRLRAVELSGDYFEFGLFRGFTFLEAQRAADRVGLSSRFFGFDSFEGLPEVKGDDQKAGIFISGDYRCTRQAVEAELSARGFDWGRATLVEGFFDQSLTPELKAKHEMERAALVMVDCDLYQSTVPVLSFLADLLQDGTIMLFDDWYCFGESEDQGEPRAFREFLDARPEWKAERYFAFPTYGQAFIMRSQAPS